VADKRNLNSGKPWSLEAIDDLCWHATHGRTSTETADFLCRTVEEVLAKAAELDLSFVDTRH
jgi:hypothetical protein